METTETYSSNKPILVANANYRYSFYSLRYMGIQKSG